MDPTKFDLDLFLSLNAEYESRRVARPAVDPAALSARAVRRADRLDRLFSLRGKRVLDLGCGRGELAHELAVNRGCEVVAVDVERYPAWAERAHPNIQFLVADLATGHDIPAASIDVIASISVMEHVRHPFGMLRACRELLAPEGRFLLVAHLYRSATGSHRSREVFFPWPHLLFTDDVFAAFYRRAGRGPIIPAWLNKLTYADYFRYFELIGYDVAREWDRRRELDQGFYARFEDELSRYSTFDLTANAVEVILSRGTPGNRVQAGATRTAPRPAPQPTFIEAWGYFGQDGQLSAAWQCPVRSEISPVAGAPRWARIESDRADSFYLSTAGGPFQNPPRDPAAWRIPPDTRCRLGIAVEAVRGDPKLELWAIEYDDRARLCHARRQLVSGTTELEWRTSPTTRALRVGIRFQGPGAALASPIAFAKEG